MEFKARHGEAWRLSVTSSITFGLTKRMIVGLFHVQAFCPFPKDSSTSLIRTGRRTGHGSVGIEIRLTDGAIRDSQPIWGKEFFISSKRPDRLWGSSPPPFQRTPMERGPCTFLEGQSCRGYQLNTQLHIVQRLSIGDFPESLRGAYVAFLPLSPPDTRRDMWRHY
jgi:hypothetical protein